MHDPMKQRILDTLRQMLGQFRGNIVEIMSFASINHAIASHEITQIITEFIANVSLFYLTNQAPDRNIEYLYVMDSILKHVQGNYVSAFGANIGYILSLMFRKAISTPDPLSRTEQLQKLLKIFKTWEVLCLFPPQVMGQIAEGN